jgi:hypothetical protein
VVRETGMLLKIPRPTWINSTAVLAASDRLAASAGWSRGRHSPARVTTSMGECDYGSLETARPLPPAAFSVED